MKKAFLVLFLLVAAHSAAAQDWAKPRLAASPRHREWVKVRSGDRMVSAFVVYPEVKANAVTAIKAPVYGFYAGNDARIGATVPKTQELMAAAGKRYDVVTYEGAGHGFMRAGETPPPAADADEKARAAYAGNKKARDEAWKRWKALLGKL